MKTKIISVALSLLIILMSITVMPLTAVTVENGISLSESTVYEGQTFEITLKIPKIDALLSNLGLKIRFDTSAFEVVSYRVPDVVGASSALGTNEEEAMKNGYISAVYGGGGDNAIDLTTGYTLTATFRVKDNATLGEYTFDWFERKMVSLQDDGYTENTHNPLNPITTATIQVVEKPVDVSGVTIQDTLNVTIGNTATPSYTINPDNASNKNVIFSAQEGKENVATINSQTGEVTGVGLGTMTITVTTEDGNYSDTCLVTVTCPGHQGGTSDCTNHAVCEICGQEYGELGNHNLVHVDAIKEIHTQTQLSPAIDEHYECSICGKLFTDETATNETTLEQLTHEAPVHVYDQAIINEYTLKTPATCIDDAVYYFSCSCGDISHDLTFVDIGSATGDHIDSDGNWEYDDENHWHTCDCNAQFDKAQHTFDQTSIKDETTLKSPATCIDDAQYYKTCICGAISKTEYFVDTGSATGDHVDSDGNWEYDDDNHWHTCDYCNTQFDKESHTYENVITESALKESATCTTDAVYYKSCKCGKLSTQTFVAEGTATNHQNFEWVIVDQHTHNKVCLDCGKIIQTTNHEFEIVGQKDPTHTEHGYTGDTVCKQCGYVSQTGSQIPKLVMPTIIEGQNAKWNKNNKGSLVFRSDANFNEFIDVLVDGIIVDKSNYILKEGSIIVELKEEFLNTLSNGKHTLSIKSTGGEATTNFTVENLQVNTNINTNTNTNTTTPQTGDNSNTFVYLIVLLVSGVCSYGFVRRKQKSK